MPWDLLWRNMLYHGLTNFAIGGSQVLMALALLRLYRLASDRLPFRWAFLGLAGFLVAAAVNRLAAALLLGNSYFRGLFIFTEIIAAVLGGVAALVCFPHAARQARRLLLRSAEAERARLAELATHAVLDAERLDRDAEREQAARAARLAGDREALLSVFSHEVKNPLAVIKGNLDLLVRRMARLGYTDPSVTKIANDLRSGVMRAERLVGDLTDVGRLGSGRFRLEKQVVDARELAARSVARWRSAPERTAAHTLTFSAPAGPIPVRWDPSRFEQVLSNLIVNALKYAPAGGDVRVSLIDEGDVVALAVADEGIGVPPWLTETIFEPYERVASPTTAAPGEGIGLYVVKQITLAHGGEVSVKPRPGGGSIFCARWPKDIADLLALPSAEAPTVATRDGGRFYLDRADDEAIAAIRASA